jgi:hypothetical protein
MVWEISIEALKTPFLPLLYFRGSKRKLGGSQEPLKNAFLK